MTAPAAAAAYWLRTLAVGGVLGMIYGFLRPLRPRLTWLADSIFVLCLLYGWVYMTFGICGGESRLGCTAALFLGVWLFDAAPGRWLRPVYGLFWRAMAGFFRIILWPLKKMWSRLMWHPVWALVQKPECLFIRKCLPITKTVIS